MLNLTKVLASKALNPKQSNSGLTLLECLVAIAVIALAASAIAPAVIVSVGTRVQSQKAEQAVQLAQAEVDNIRLLIERGGDYSTEIASVPITTAAGITGTGAPTSFAASLDSTTTNVAKLVNVDNDAEDEFAIQVFRTQGLLSGTPSVPIAFELGIRVYDNRAASPNLSAGLLTEPAPLQLSTSDTNRSSRPLAVLYTNILRGDREGSLCQYWQYIDSTASTAGIDCS